MKRRSLFFLTAIVSFVFGIASASIWISKRSPTPPPITSSTDCTTVYDAAIVNTRIKDNDDPQFFAAFQEPPLYVMPDCVDEAYGLEWVPSFDGPVLVRIWRSQNRYFMVAKELDSKGWSKFGKIRETNTRALTPFEWRSFTDLLLWDSFWKMPSTINEPSPNDGAAWLVNGLRAKEYHWARRRVPDDRITGLSNYVIRLSG